MNTKSTVFRPVAVKRRGLVVAEQILEAIRDGVLDVGDRLPSERELADQTGVSRPSVREGLSALQLAGVVETRHGDGTFVTDAARDVALLSSILTDLRRGPLSEALEARRVLERAGGELIILRRSPRTIADMASALKDLQTAARGRDFEAYSQANEKFHGAFARAVGNSILEAALVPLANIMLQSLGRELRKRDYDSDPTFFDANFAVHQSIHDAIVDGNLEDLLEAIDHHYGVIQKVL